MESRARTLALAGAGTIATGLFLWRGSRRRSEPALQTVWDLDLRRYMGRWFEIARYPARFQRECAKNSLAEYALLPNGTVRVENRCTAADGRIICARGTAKVADSRTRAKFKVRFSPFMPGADYWVIDLDAAYRWAVVGEPKRRYLWILSRTPAMDPATFSAICERLRQQRYIPERLIRTPQDGA